MLLGMVSALGLPPKEQPKCHRTIARYAARLIDSRRWRYHVRQLPPTIRRSMASFKRWADSSPYWGSLWRSLVKPQPSSSLCKDIKWVESHLTKTDLSTLTRIRRYRSVSTKRLSASGLTKIARLLQEFCAKQVSYKLRFVYQYDTGVDKEDLMEDLMETALRAIRNVEHHGNWLQTVNHAKAAARNKAVNLAYWYTASKRARLVSAHSSSREYETTTSSLDATPDLFERPADPQQLVATIQARLGPAYASWAQCVLGLCPDFDHHLVEWAGVKVEKLRLPQLGKLAQRWTGLSSSDLETLGFVLCEG